MRSKCFRVKVRAQSLWLAAMLAAWPLGAWSAGHEPATDSFYRLMREASLALLKEGNIRYSSGHPNYPNADAERRHSTSAEGQQPFATILACSDSRDPVEFIFDRGIGDVFVVRVAGNVAGISEIATIEYGVNHLHTPLLVVMGHTKCGAVTAVATGAELHGYLPRLAEKIKPAVAKVKEQGTAAEELVPRAIEANIWQVISDLLRQSPDLRESAVKGHVQIVGALYDLDTGVVKWLGSHPNQKELLGDKPPGAVAAHAPEKPLAAHPAPPLANVEKKAQDTHGTAPPAKNTAKAKSETINTIDMNPGLDIEEGTTSLLPAQKKKQPAAP